MNGLRGNPIRKCIPQICCGDVYKRQEEKKAKDEDILASLQMVNEMLQRGYEFLPIRIGKSRAKTYTVEDGKIRLPFMALKGLGDAAANTLEKACLLYTSRCV